MTKTELLRLVNLVNANWPLDASTSKQDVLTLWWTCLQDLQDEEVASVVSSVLIESPQWRPRPGEIRKRVIDCGKPWPSPEAAWGLAEGRRLAADMGVDVPEVDGPAGLEKSLSEAMRAARGQGKAGFVAAWTEMTGRRYALPSRETQLDGVQLDDAP